MVTEWQKWGYAVEKFGTAIYVMATGPQDLRTRIYNAYMHFHPCTAENFPEELQSDYEWIRNQLKSFGSAEDSLRQLDDETIQKLAEKIYHIHSAVESKWVDSGPNETG